MPMPNADCRRWWPPNALDSTTVAAFISTRHIKANIVQAMLHQRRICRLLIILSVVSSWRSVLVLAFVGPSPMTALPRISCHHRRKQQHRNRKIRNQFFHQLNFREGIDDGNSDTDASSVAVATTSVSNQSSSGTATTLHSNNANNDQPSIDNQNSNSSNNSDNSPIKTASKKNNEKSNLRLMKARRLLEMAQITPSQRLETMQNNNSNMNDDYFTTVVPMGSYSMRFGGFGSLEEELEQPAPLPSQSAVLSQQQQQQHQGMYELRMADTFDSVDNLVDSKSSLLPGGRWMSTDDNGSGGNDASSSATTKGTQRQSQPQTSSTSSTTTIVAVAEPLVQYDPIAAEKLLFVQPTKWLVRNVQIAFPFGLWVAGILMDNIFAVEKVNRKKRARELNSIIGSLGPAIISKCLIRNLMITLQPFDSLLNWLIPYISISTVLIIHRGRTGIGIPA